jgi:hypothetical protein
MHSFPIDDDRLRELILHISARCADWEAFDSAFLERMLFQADFLHFRAHGVSITGQTWRRGVLGPSPRGMSRVLRSPGGDFAVREMPMGDGLHVRRKPAALRAARLEGFGSPELATLDTVIRHYRNGGGGDLLVIPWHLARPREKIPYVLALVGQTPRAVPPGQPGNVRGLMRLTRESLEPAT